MQDADGADTHSWTVPLDECGVTGTFDDTNNVWKYDLYFNSNSGKVFQNSIFTDLKPQAEFREISKFLFSSLNCHF